MKVGVQLWPQHTTVAALRDAWRRADDLGVDSIFLWDHFFPITEPLDGAHFEGYTLLSAMAVETRRAHVGLLVTCNSYRSPDLLADMVRTIDHLSDGRAVLAIGAGWAERDYVEYGFDFGSAPDRLRDLGAALSRIRARLAALNPPPLQDPLPLMVGGGGEKVTLRLVAEHATAWNSYGPPEQWARKNTVLDEWCERLGRDPRAIERTASVNLGDPLDIDAWRAAGAEQLVVGLPAPFDLGVIQPLLAARG